MKPNIDSGKRFEMRRQLRLSKREGMGQRLTAAAAYLQRRRRRGAVLGPKAKQAGLRYL
ncbi:MAG: hypothetical protein R2856_26865 [Caldilineaceae bacterium]